MEKCMEINLDTTGIHDLSKETMKADELKRMTSEEYILNQVGKVGYTDEKEKE